MKNKELDNILDNVGADIRAEQLDSSAVHEAADRVWMKMSSLEAGHCPPESESAMAGGSPPLNAAGSANRIESCAEFQKAMAAYLRRELLEARALLAVDRTH